ncbi:hypothetical protein ACFLZ8_06480 [Planctomycetota bacterium]
MGYGRLEEKLKDKKSFIVYAELTGGPGFKYDPILKFLKAYSDTDRPTIPSVFNFFGIILPQNPDRIANIQQSDIIEKLRAENLLGEQDVILNITCKDYNAYGIKNQLAGYRNNDIQSVIAIIDKARIHFLEYTSSILNHLLFARTTQ